MYSVGKIPGGFFRREGRPSEHETLNARAIDRPLRPLFDENFRNEVQVINTVMSVNPDNSPEIAALLGSSLSIGLGGIPFNGPVAMVQVGRVNGELIAFAGRLHLLAGRRDALDAPARAAWAPGAL